MKANNSIFKTFSLSLCIIANTHFAYGQTASILPPAETTFVDQNGKPLTSGTVDFYIPSTTTRKTTWKDAGETVPNTNPVVLDSAGRALILGSGNYRQIVKDRVGNLIWDQVTSSTGSGGSAPTATGDGDLVGTIKPWAGMTAPNQYMFTYGQEVSRTTFAALFAAITSTQATFCTPSSPIITGLSDTTNFWVGMSVEISCVVTGVSTIVSKTASTVTLAANSNVNSSTVATFFPWGNGNSSTTFNIPDYRGFTIAGNNNMGGVASSTLTTTYFGIANPNSTGGPGGSQFATLATANLPPQTPSGTITVTNGAITVSPASVLNTAGSIVNSGGTGGAGAATSTSASQATSTATFTGTAFAGQTSTPVSVVQPTKTSNYIIKVTPDANSATASGVTDINGMTGSINCGTGLLCSGNNISVSGVNGFLLSANNLSDVANTTTAVENLFNGQYIGALVNSFGALNDGATDNARYFFDAATFASANKVGLLFKSGSNYRTTPIQFGGSNPTTGTFTGSITTTTLTVTSTPTVPLTIGQTLTGAGVSAGTIITGFGTKTGGWIGTYTVNNSQTVGPITFTATAPSCTGSIAGTTLTISACANGSLNLVDSLVGSGIISGTTITALGSGTGGAGTYTVSYSQTVGSTTIRAYPLTVAPLPNFITGAVGGETQTIIASFGSNAIPTPLVKIVDPPSLGVVLGFEIAHLRINAVSQNSNALTFHGFSNTSSGGQPHAHDLTVTGATGSTCGMNVVGNNIGGSWGVIEAQFSRISAVGNTICDYNFDGNNGDGSYNIQALLMERISANSAASGDGFIQDYANTSCVECLSQNMTGKAVNLDHTHHSKWYDFYAEATAAFTGTANSLGVELSGQLGSTSSPNATLLSCVSCDIDIYDGTNFIRNAGAITASGQITSTFGTPTIASGACGTTTNGTISGTNQSGIVTIGAAATTTCTISFSTTITAPKACIIFPGNATAAVQGTTVARVGTPSTTNWVIAGSVLANTVYSYICL